MQVGTNVGKDARLPQASMHHHLVSVQQWQCQSLSKARISTASGRPRCVWAEFSLLKLYQMDLCAWVLLGGHQRMASQVCVPFEAQILEEQEKLRVFSVFSTERRGSSHLRDVPGLVKDAQWIADTWSGGCHKKSSFDHNSLLASSRKDSWQFKTTFLAFEECRKIRRTERRHSEEWNPSWSMESRRFSIGSCKPFVSIENICGIIIEKLWCSSDVDRGCSRGLWERLEHECHFFLSFNCKRSVRKLIIWFTEGIMNRFWCISLAICKWSRGIKRMYK